MFALVAAFCMFSFSGVPDRLSFFAWNWVLLGLIWKAIKRGHPGPQGDGEPSAKKQSVAHSTFVKWQAELDRECQTMSWLDCEVSMSGVKKIVAKLKCKVCVKFESKIAGRRNYSNKWIVGADSVCTSNIKEHAHTDQHAHAMFLLKKEQSASAGLGPSSYAPIAKALSMLPDDSKAKLRVKFAQGKV